MGYFVMASAGNENTLDTFITAIKGALSEFTTTNLAQILVAALSITVGIVIAWMAYRFITRKVTKSFKGGRM